MKKLLFLLFILHFNISKAQLTVDSAKTVMTVKEKSVTGLKSITIYKSFVEGKGIRHQAVYLPVSESTEVEPEQLNLSIASELPTIKRLLDASIGKRNFNLSRFAFNILPYNDLCAKLADIYANAAEWNAYLTKNPDRKRTISLLDGTEITEVSFDEDLAKAILDKSDFLNQLKALFAPYGYTITVGGFPYDHQEILSVDKLKACGKNTTLFVPIPHFYFNLTKITK
jgi:hypothetical protein